MLTRIISGGQKGVDQAALRMAMKHGIEHGGWCPPGRESEEGAIPDIFNLDETPEERSSNAPDTPRSLRTEWNVRDSDATLIITTESANLGPGLEWTVKAASIHAKPIIIVNPEVEITTDRVLKWLKDHQVEVLNVAGPSERAMPGISRIAASFLERLLSSLIG